MILLETMLEVVIGVMVMEVDKVADEVTGLWASANPLLLCRQQTIGEETVVAEPGGGRGTSGRCPEPSGPRFRKATVGALNLQCLAMTPHRQGPATGGRLHFLSSLSREPGGPWHELMLCVERKPDSQ